MGDEADRRRAAELAAVVRHEIDALQAHLTRKRAELAELVKRAKGDEGR